MPRKRIFIKTSNWNKVNSGKYRIGNRKSGVPANSLSTKQLLAIIADSGKSKYHANAISVLKSRNNIATTI